MRRKDREITDIDEIERIVNQAKILHLGLIDEEFPYIVPLHFGYERTENGYVFYVHSALEGKKITLLQKNPNVFVEMETDVELASGGDIPCKYGSYYASVMGKGKAELLKDDHEKSKGLRLLMKNQTGKDFEFSSEMVQKVAVVRILVEEITAKGRIKS